MSEINFEGLNEVLDSLDSITDEARIKAALSKACALVERAAKQKAPKDTGELRRSIESRIENDGENFSGVVFTPLEYAPYVEYGTGIFAEENGRQTGWAYEDEETKEKIWTRGQHPQPYMRPALNENREEILRILREGISND